MARPPGRRDDTTLLAAIQERSYTHAGPGIRESYPKAQAMDAASLAKFLDEKEYAVLATARPDGRPHAAPIAYTVWGSGFWIGSVRGARVRNLRARPYACIVVMEGEGASHRAVVAEGPVTLHDPAEFNSLPKQLRDLWRRRHGGAPTWAAVLIELRPSRLFSYDARKKDQD